MCFNRGEDDDDEVEIQSDQIRKGMTECTRQDATDKHLSIVNKTQAKEVIGSVSNAEYAIMYMTFAEVLARLKSKQKKMPKYMHKVQVGNSNTC